MSLGCGWSNQMEGGVFIYLEMTEGGMDLGRDVDEEFCLGKIKFGIQIEMFDNLLDIYF